MGIFVGFHLEGWDYLILRAFLARLLGIPENEICADPIDASGRGWSFIMEQLPVALHRFYGRCAQFAVVGVDNDGHADLVHTGDSEDPRRPRHWNHSRANADCRYCQVMKTVETVRTRLTYLPMKPGSSWPVLVVVPVEAIEAWILVLQSILSPGSGLRRAEDFSSYSLKQRLYGKPAATRNDVDQVALPLVREATVEHLTQLRTQSRSFDLFASQVEQGRPQIVGPRDCWGNGDGVGERI